MFDFAVHPGCTAFDVGVADSDTFDVSMKEICAKIGDAGSGGGLNLVEAIAELNPFDDLGQAVLAVEFAPFPLRREGGLVRKSQETLSHP